MSEKEKTIRASVRVAIIAVGTMALPIKAHHSFAMYDRNQTKTVTGKLIRFIPGANHAQLIFEVVGPDGAPAEFTGAVGRFELESLLVPARPAAGEPVTWTLRLKGTGMPASGGRAAGDQYVRLTVMLPAKPDEQLAKFIEDWPGADLYDPRRKAGLS